MPRRGVVRYRRKNVKGGFLIVHVLRRRGPKGGRTTATYHKAVPGKPTTHRIRRKRR